MGEKHEEIEWWLTRNGKEVLPGQFLQARPKESWNQTYAKYQQDILM